MYLTPTRSHSRYSEEHALLVQGVGLLVLALPRFAKPVPAIGPH